MLGLDDDQSDLYFPCRRDWLAECTSNDRRKVMYISVVGLILLIILLMIIF
jgi:hypothetical protein